MVYILLAFLGLCFGSFVNALVFRLHETQNSKSKKQQANLSVLNGRSMCVNCRHTLAWYDLIPVVSWLMLRAKCRYCNKPISIQYPLVETTAALLFVSSYLVWPYGFDALGWLLFGFWLIFLIGFLAMTVYDLRWMLLPDKLTYPLAALAAVQVLLNAILANDFSIIIGAVIGLVTVGGLFYALFQVSKGKWIGGGDVKLGFGLGLLAGGFTEGFMIIFLASLLGTLVSIPLLIHKGGLKHRIPFGPLLITATIIVYLFGSALITWYERQVYLV